MWVSCIRFFCLLDLVLVDLRILVNLFSQIFLGVIEVIDWWYSCCFDSVKSMVGLVLNLNSLVSFLEYCLICCKLVDCVIGKFKVKLLVLFCDIWCVIIQFLILR